MNELKTLVLKYKIAAFGAVGVVFVLGAIFGNITKSPFPGDKTLVTLAPGQTVKCEAAQPQAYKVTTPDGKEYSLGGQEMATWMNGFFAEQVKLKAAQAQAPATEPVTQ